MSPKVRVFEDPVEKAVAEVELPDKVGSTFEGTDGTRAEVSADGTVIFVSPLLHGAQEVFSGKRVNGEGLTLGFGQEGTRVDLLGQQGSEKRLFRVTAEPTERRGSNPERR